MWEDPAEFPPKTYYPPQAVIALVTMLAEWRFWKAVYNGLGWLLCISSTQPQLVGGFNSGNRKKKGSQVGSTPFSKALKPPTLQNSKEHRDARSGGTSPFGGLYLSEARAAFRPFHPGNHVFVRV